MPDNSQQSKDAFVLAYNASLKMLWGNPESAVPFSYYASTVHQLAFPLCFNNQLCGAGFTEVEPGHIDRNNDFRLLPKTPGAEDGVVIGSDLLRCDTMDGDKERPEGWEWLQVK